MSGKKILGKKKKEKKKGEKKEERDADDVKVILTCWNNVNFIDFPFK